MPKAASSKNGAKRAAVVKGNLHSSCIPNIEYLTDPGVLKAKKPVTHFFRVMVQSGTPPSRGVSHLKIFYDPECAEKIAPVSAHRARSFGGLVCGS